MILLHTKGRKEREVRRPPVVGAAGERGSRGEGLEERRRNTLRRTWTCSMTPRFGSLDKAELLEATATTVGSDARPAVIAEILIESPESATTRRPAGDPDRASFREGRTADSNRNGWRKADPMSMSRCVGVGGAWPDENAQATTAAASPPSARLALVFGMFTPVPEVARNGGKTRR